MPESILVMSSAIGSIIPYASPPRLQHKTGEMRVMLVRDILDRRTATATAKVTPKAKVTATTSAAAAPPLVGLELRCAQ